MSQLVLGPHLRYTGSTEATVWVETDAPCNVTVLGHSARSFAVEGHHYAIVVLDGLESGAVREYEVHLDGERVWPLDDGRPPSVIRTREHERHARLVFGSCRVGAPERPPYTLSRSQHPEGFEIDALWAYSRRLQAGHGPWPDCLLLLGDQVYADEVSPETLAYIRRTRDTSQPPGEGVASFEEYTRLYREAWSDPDIRWLLATVPTTMIFDDHDVRDDWNISDAWVQEMRAKPWWDARITGAFMAYYLYQHLGSLAPPQLAEEPMLAALQGEADGGERLRGFARMADRESGAARWAYHRDFGRSRLIVVDSRAARVLAGGQRDMVDTEEWAWISEHARGGFDHLIVASTLPVFLPQGIHFLEAWNEAVCAGAWGRPAASIGERLRRAVDLEHWAAFQRSFASMVELVGEVSTGPEAPATVTFLGGDVHTAYVAEVRLRDHPHARVHQLVCSPFRNPLRPRERRVMRAMSSRPAAAVGRLLARTAGVRPLPVDWRVRSGPTFDNSLGVLVLDERAAHVTIYSSGPEEDGGPPLTALHECQLADG